MPMIINEESALGKELARWNRPYVFRPYPKMVYRAQKVNGKSVCVMPAPSQFGWRDAAEYQQAILHAEAITAQNQRTVQDESEHQKARSEGWRETPQAALDSLEAQDQEFARIAAENNFKVRGMSDPARREYQAAEDTTHEHIVDIKPKRKYARKAKGTTVAVTGRGEVNTAE